MVRDMLIYKYSDKSLEVKLMLYMSSIIIAVDSS